MTEADTRNVGAAFELLIEELAKAGDKKREGSEAFLAGRYRDVEVLLEGAKAIEQIIKKVSALQEDWLQVSPREVRVEREPEDQPPSQPDSTPVRPDEWQVQMRYNGVHAKGRYLDLNNSITLLEGSTIRRESHESLSDTLRDLRLQCQRNGRLVNTDDSEFLRVTKPIEFGSPSAAAQFVAGCSVSGNREWLLQSTQVPLGHRRRNPKPED
jgi:Domain of unknown function (DUF4357)